MRNCSIHFVLRYSAQSFRALRMSFVCVPAMMDPDLPYSTANGPMVPEMTFLDAVDMFEDPSSPDDITEILDPFSEYVLVTDKIMKNLSSM
ncbi:MAG: hypothetical protein A2V88_07180 [Elusimicrobia bacterium RBG_16_66_12]|nr:MAG: hypothetical protein A2V88_07180 [Elusimicrobia bacterium RBG_16_66_12]